MSAIMTGSGFRCVRPRSDNDTLLEARHEGRQGRTKAAEFEHRRGAPGRWARGRQAAQCEAARRWRAEEGSAKETARWHVDIGE